MRIVRHIPNAITSMNLFCGLMGVIFTFKGDFQTAFILMLAAAACDFCDGFAARMLNAYSDMGKELDSLADMVSFGALPALMMHRLMIITGTDGIWSYIPLLIGVFSALRLAKFNIDTRQTESFIGLATPACAMICGSFAYYVISTPFSVLHGWATCTFFIPAVSLILSFLLVSEIPMFSMKLKKGSKLSDRANIQRLCFAAIVVLACIITLIAGLNWSFIVLLSFTAYILLNLGFALIR